MLRTIWAIGLSLLCAHEICGAQGAQTASEGQTSARINELADRFTQLQLNYDPTLAYFIGLPAPDHARLPDRRPQAIRALEQQEDEISRELAGLQDAPVSSPSNVTRAVLREILDSHREKRVCRTEYWELSHLEGWQVGFAALAEAQPVDTPELRSAALRRWALIPPYLDVQRANLRAGLHLGYSVPKSVVRRVVQQLDGLLGSAPEQSPLYSPAQRAHDERFSAQMRSVITERINPAIGEFRAFLIRTYLPRARDTLAISALPDGARCYQALLRGYTTLDRTPAQVSAIGEKAVADNERTVAQLGSQLYGTTDVAQIIRLNKEAAGNRFSSADELLSTVRSLLPQALEKTRPYFLKLPDQPVVIEGVPDYQAGTGVQAHYEPQPDLTKPAKYVEPAQEWKSDTRGSAEVTLVHETLPGHHLQVALSRELTRGSALASLSDMAAYTEGWARYAEGLAEEAGIYQSDYARIARRIWPARGMVLDPGIHAFGWSRQKAVDYLKATGLFDTLEAQALVDRIAVMPGQLTAYDTGGLEIRSLRAEAQAALGSRFNFAQFHQRVLEQGIVPLGTLREHVRAWIQSEADNHTALIDRESLFADPEISEAQLSPDGRWLAFLKPFKGTRNLWVKTRTQPFEQARLLTQSTASPLAHYRWSRNSQYLLYTLDVGGDENVNIYSVRAQDASGEHAGVPASRNLTQMKGVQAQIYELPKRAPDLLYVGLNDRDAAWHDLYRIELSSGKRTLVHRNDERITGWTFDLDGRVRIATRETDAGATELLRVDADRLTPIYSCSVFETCTPLKFHHDGRRLYLLTNRGADTQLIHLVLLDVHNGHEELVDSDPDNRVDLAEALFSPRTDELIATVYDNERRRLVSHDSRFGADYELVQNRLPGKDLTINGTADDRLWLVRAEADIEPGETWLFDRRTKQLTLQFRQSEQLPRETLAHTQSVHYPSSDGLEIPAYLTLPQGIRAENLPLVVLPHGGPWARDEWGYHPLVQFFANRGFAVLQPNFRGSTGYGKSFLDAGNGQWSQKMQDDLTWGVKYLVAQHIADPGRVAIVGGSYGGYAALAGAAFTPQLYGAVVSICGPSNLITLLDSIPPYWESVRALFHERMGDPRTPMGREQLERQSPLSAADQIEAPLLVIQGANDPRVKQAESDQIVTALASRGAPVEYLVAPDEGHGFARPLNRLAAFAVTERFLAEHLGTRFQENLRPEVAERVAQLTVNPHSLVRTPRQ